MKQQVKDYVFSICGTASKFRNKQTNVKNNIE